MLRDGNLRLNCCPYSMERLTRDLMGIACNYFSAYISTFHMCQPELYAFSSALWSTLCVTKIQFDGLVSALRVFNWNICIRASCSAPYICIIKLLAERSPYYIHLCERKKVEVERNQRHGTLPRFRNYVIIRL